MKVSLTKSQIEFLIDALGIAEAKIEEDAGVCGYDSEDRNFLKRIGRMIAKLSLSKQTQS